jgi:hypothetical protein
MTLGQAEAQLDEYLLDVARALRSGAPPDEIKRMSGLTCDENWDKNPSGTFSAGRSYLLKDVPPSEQTRYYDALKQWWQRNGFSIVDESTLLDGSLSVSARNAAGFGMGIMVARGVNVYLDGSTPCVLPDSTTAPPGSATGLPS